MSGPEAHRAWLAGLAPVFVECAGSEAARSDALNAARDLIRNRPPGWRYVWKDDGARCGYLVEPIPPNV